MNNGWIKLHRQVLDNHFCTNSAERLGFWTMLLLKANHEDIEFFMQNQKISCKSGQFVTGRKSLALEADVSEMKVERWLSVLESEQQIEQQKTNKFRLITIAKWKEYQILEQQNAQQMNNKRTTDEQQMNTNKNDKKVKNEKKHITLSNDNVVDVSVQVTEEPITPNSGVLTEMIQEFKRVTKRPGIKIILSDKRRRSIRKRLEEFTKLEILAAWAAMAEDEWLVGENDRGRNFLTFDYALRADRIEYWLSKARENQPRVIPQRSKPEMERIVRPDGTSFEREILLS